eukprot:TRINITY_DN36410_c0_g1_i1.p1 TRINITY_DN36410_c0_g1~~TRINITY_DN36410_c0_g1_i1.p1  ORF type:complete len:294 (+),score=59.41 TRINITY_DN36410_c0_g1_i1:223-1104(+)
MPNALHLRNDAFAGEAMRAGQVRQGGYPGQHVLWGGVDSMSGSQASRGTPETSGHNPADLSGTSEMMRKDRQRAYVLEALQDLQLRSESDASKDLSANSRDAGMHDQVGMHNQEAGLNQQEPLEQQAGQAELHERGKCTPCHYMATRNVCKKGDSCCFCHMPHEVQAKPRPRKAKRAYCKRAADELESICQANPAGLKEYVETLLRHGTYMSMVVKSKLKVMEKGGDYPAAVAEQVAKVLREVDFGPEQHMGKGDDDEDSGAEAENPQQAAASSPDPAGRQAGARWARGKLSL